MSETQDRVVSLEKSTHSGLQHNRKWNLEIDGIPSNIGDDPKELEVAAIKIIEAINVPVSPDEIDAIHRLPARRNIPHGSIPPPKSTIIRFKSRKVVEAINLNKKKLKNIGELDIKITGLNNDSRIFIRPSLCPYYSNLAYNCRVLKRNKVITSVNVTEEGKIIIKERLGDDGIKVNHESVLLSYFPDFEHFNFDYDRHDRI